MKTAYLIVLALFLSPLISLSQQLSEKELLLKKESNKSTVRKVDLNQIQIQSTDSKQMIKPFTENESIELGIPEDFPRCQNTGNKRLDEDNYYKAQEIWIKNNPDRFNKIKNNSFLNN